jgi:hypothetical protein
MHRQLITLLFFSYLGCINMVYAQSVNPGKRDQNANQSRPQTENFNFFIKRFMADAGFQEERMADPRFFGNYGRLDDDPETYPFRIGHSPKGRYLKVMLATDTTRFMRYDFGLKKGKWMVMKYTQEWPD